MMTKEQIAAVLFAEWLWEDGYGRLPTNEDWREYETAQDLNGAGLRKANFLEQADVLEESLRRWRDGKGMR